MARVHDARRWRGGRVAAGGAGAAGGNADDRGFLAPSYPAIDQLSRLQPRSRQLASLKGPHMSEVRHQLLITTVHGTWGRGFFPGRQRQNRRPWFGEESPFLDRLIQELDDIPHKITPLLWSGENSIYKRDETAHILAEHLSAQHAEHPQATQLVIAHSHGGNIALRALYLLRKPDASRLCGAEIPTPLVVTLATPFVEVQHADLGDRPSVIRFMVLYAMAYLVLTVLLLGEFLTTVLKPVLLPVASSLGVPWSVRSIPIRHPTPLVYRR
jgi:hypothetical protein